jgi:hypothetical protein
MREMRGLGELEFTVSPAPLQSVLSSLLLISRIADNF